MKFKSLLILLTAIFLNTSCSDSSTDINTESKTTNELLSFTLEKSRNTAYLDEDIVGVIQNGEILLTFKTKVDATNLIATFKHNGNAVFVGAAVQVSGATTNDLSKLPVYSVEAENKERKQYAVKIVWPEEKLVNIPHFYIDTDGQAPIVSKDDYLNAKLRIVGGDNYENFEATTKIKGRGNSTWNMPKKPYRLKLTEKASLLGLTAEKDWVLLQNYIDPSLMGNAVAMKIGQLLEMPFTHHIIPVDVTVNGKYLGSYTLTEQKEVKESRINVGEGGWLIELDTYFDEDYRFYSKNFELPVMIQYPKLDKMTQAEAMPIFEEMKSDFNAVDDLIYAASFPNNNYLDFFDANAFVDFLIVYTLTGNEEINHPKSTYIYKKKGGKYSMGPIWDFDWAYGFEGTNTHFVDPTRSLFWSRNTKGKLFFSKIAQDPAIKSLYKTEWPRFKAEKYPLLVEYINEYARTIKKSHAKDQDRWKQSSGDIDKYSKRLLSWLEKRVEYMDGLAAGS